MLCPRAEVSAGLLESQAESNFQFESAERKSTNIFFLVFLVQISLVPFLFASLKVSEYPSLEKW